MLVCVFFGKRKQLTLLNAVLHSCFDVLAWIRYSVLCTCAHSGFPFSVCFIATESMKV